jgi:[CysO sulfur-carrier protein]-S-L-cysteine hydrolase
MNPFRLVIPHCLIQEMIAQAVAECPNECGGIFAGRIAESEVVAIARYSLRNELASPNRYRSNAYDLFAAMRKMRDDGTEILAVYHSHPTSPPIPSLIDLAERYSDDVVTIIVSLSAEPVEFRGWWLTEKNYTEAKIRIREG